VALTSTGIAPVNQVLPLGPLGFGNILITKTSSAQVVTVKNTGTAQLVINRISLNGGNPNQFKPEQ
jgi:hypothetical protein